MKMIVATVIALSALISSQAFASGIPRWQQTYYADQWGNVIHGDPNTLVRRINAGWDVKIVYRRNGVSKSFVCETVLVKGHQVACVHTSEVSLTHDEFGNYRFQPDVYHYYIVVNSTGAQWVSRWLVGEHTKRSESRYSIAVKWFTRR